MNFFGFFRLAEDTVTGVVSVVNDTNNPTAAEDDPTFRIYGPDGVLIDDGTCTPFDDTNLTGAYQFSFETTSPEYARGTAYTVIVSYSVLIASVSSDRHVIYTFIVT